MADYRIELGVKLKDSDIQNQINDAQKTLKPIEIKVDAETKELTNTIKEALNNLSKGTKNTLTLDTTALEGSLREVKDAILDIKKAFGTFDDKSGMKSLLASINQIADTIGRVTDETDTLVKSLNTLSKKEFGFNFNLKTGNANPLKAATDYGIEARRKAIPAMQEQVAYLQDILGGTEKADKALERYLVKQYKGFGGVTEKNRLQREMLGGTDLDGKTISYNKQMGAFETTIDHLKKLVVESGRSLAGFDAQFSKSAENIVDDTVKVQTGVKQTEEALEAASKEMKQIFGGGVSAEGLSASLEPIITNLNEIKIAIQDLSKGVSFDGLTASFDRLSESIEKLVQNATKVKNVLGDGLGAEQKIVQSSTGLENVENDFKEIDSVIDITEDSVDALRETLNKLGVNSTGIDLIIKDIQEMGVEVQRIKTEISGNNLKLSITGLKETEDGIKRIANEVRTFPDVISNPENIKRSVTETFETSLDKSKQEAEKVNKSFKEIYDIRKKIGSLEVDLVGAKAKDDAKTIDVINDEITRLTKNVSSLDKGGVYSSKFTDAQKADLKELNELIEYSKKQAQNKVDYKLDLDKAKAEVKEVNEAYKQMLETQKKIRSLSIEEKKLTELGNTNELNEVSTKLKELKSDYEALKRAFGEKLTSTQFGNLQAEIDETESELKQLDAKIADTRAELARKIKIDIELGNFDNEISGIDDKLNRLSHASDELRDSVTQVKNAYEQMELASKGTGDEVTDRERLIQAEQNYARALERTNNLLRVETRREKTDNDRLKLDDDINVFQSKIDAWLTKNSAATKKFGADMLDLKAKAESVDRVTLNHLEKEFRQLDNAAEKAGLKGLSAFDRIKTKFKEYASYLSAAEVFMWVEQGLREMFNTVKEIDTAMTGLYRVTDLTAAQYDTLFNSMIDSAKEYGATLNDIINATTDWVRAGFDADTSLGLAEVTTMYQHISDLDYDTAAENLITAYNGFKDELNGAFSGDTVGAVEYIADIFNELDK